MLIDELLAKIYTDELRKEATLYRLITSAQRHSVKKKYSYALALVWLGSRLCKWGHLLQERFGDSGKVNPSHAMKSGIKV